MSHKFCPILLPNNHLIYQSQRSSNIKIKTLNTRKLGQAQQDSLYSSLHSYKTILFYNLQKIQYYSHWQYFFKKVWWWRQTGWSQIWDLIWAPACLLFYRIQSNLDISNLMGLFFTSSNYRKCKLICTSGNLDL